MIRVTYAEMDGPEGLTCRLEAAGHAGYAPAGQDIVCAGASTLMQSLVCLLADEEGVKSDAWDAADGPGISVTAMPPVSPQTEGALECAKVGFTLLAERYPDNLRFADVSRRGEQQMMDLQLFADGDGGAEAPVLSPAQERQAIASGTMKPEKPAEKSPVSEPPEPEKTEESPERTEPTEPVRQLPPAFPRAGQNVVENLHRQWASEETALRQEHPEFSLRKELKNPEMRRLMQLPGMRMQDAYRLAHYDDALRETARTVEQGVVERIQQRALRPAENGIRPGGAAVTRADVEHMTRAQREALERQALHGMKIQF